MLASPVFFYAVSAQTKILMDRCQSLWVKRYWLEKTAIGRYNAGRKGLLISVGATKRESSLTEPFAGLGIFLISLMWNYGDPFFIAV
jgi:multimeric flavodoxin WrbA